MKKKDFFKTISLLILFTFISYVFPFLSILIYIIWPIPVVHFIIKYSIGESIFLIALAAIANSLIVGLTINTSTGIIMGMYSVLGFGLIGFFLGSGIKERFSPFKTMVLTLLAVVFSNLAIIFALPYVLGFNYQELLGGLRSFLQESKLFPEYLSIVEQTIYLIKILFPSLIIISSSIHGILIYYTTTWYLRKRGVDLHQYKPFRSWRFPRWWVSLGLVLALLLRTYLQYDFRIELTERANMFIINIVVLLFFLIFLQGFAVMINWLAKRNFGFLTIIFVFSLFFFNIIIVYILIFIGFIDMWFNLRKDQTG